MLAVALSVWLIVLLFLVALTLSSGVVALVVLVSLPTVLLCVVVALRGLRRAWTWVWVLGTGTVLLISGPAVQRWLPSDELHGLAIAIGAFVYAQVYFALLGVLDHFWIARQKREESDDEARFRLRRMLQVRLLLATLVVVFGATSSRNDGYPQVMPLGVLFGFCGVPILVGAWARWRPVAWWSAATIAVIALVNLLPGDSGVRQQTLLQYGWAELVAVYLWVKAARVWYWPRNRSSPGLERVPHTSPDPTA
jgi:hypothetical protein